MPFRGPQTIEITTIFFCSTTPGTPRINYFFKDPWFLETFNYQRVTRKVMGCALDFFQRTEDNHLFRRVLMGRREIKMQLFLHCMLYGPLLNLTVTLSHCPPLGLTGGCDILWKGDTAFQVPKPVPVASFGYLFFHGPRSLK